MHLPAQPINYFLRQALCMLGDRDEFDTELDEWRKIDCSGDVGTSDQANH